MPASPSDRAASGPGTQLGHAIAAARHELTTPQSGGLSYYADTSAAGRPLVLVHSINAAPSAVEVKPLFEQYRGRRPVYALDLPGFGFSERSDRRYSPELYAGALLDILERVVREPADVVALSLSAEFAARAVALAPTRFTSLTLISPTGVGRRNPPGGKTGARLHRVFSLPAFGDGLFKLVTSRRSIRYFLRLSFVGDPPEELIDYAYATSHQPGAKFAPFYFLSTQLFTRDARDHLYAPLRLPVLVLYDRDPNVSFERLPELLAEHANWQATRIEPTLGLPHWEKLEQTTAAMDTFWAGARPSSSAADQSS